jgi:hypothetical protein
MCRTEQKEVETIGYISRLAYMTPFTIQTVQYCLFKTPLRLRHVSELATFPKKKLCVQRDL